MNVNHNNEEHKYFASHLKFLPLINIKSSNQVK